MQASAVQQSSPEGWSKDQFSCSDCCKLLYNPVVLNCGHAVCHATCRPQAPASDDPVCPRCDAPSVGTPAICTQVRTCHGSTRVEVGIVEASAGQGQSPQHSLAGDRSNSIVACQQLPPCTNVACVAYCASLLSSLTLMRPLASPTMSLLSSLTLMGHLRLRMSAALS